MSRAVILAGGRGARLRPYTSVLPKPLMPLGDVPVLDVVLRQLAKEGFDRVTVATGYLGELIETYCGDGSRYGLALDYSRETTPLGTAGPLGLIDDLPETFLVMNGDLLTTLSYRDVLAAHEAGDAAATIATRDRAVEIDFGVIEAAEDGRVTTYTEKPSLSYLVSMGVYAFSRRILDRIPAGESFDFPQLVQALLDGGEIVMTYASDAFWLDIGRHEDYERAVDEFETLRPKLL